MLALNILADNDHVGKEEWRIRVLKKWVHILATCILPHPHSPQHMIIHLLYFVTMWLNNLPTTHGISPGYSPHEIVLHHRLSHKQHCRAPFGVYCKMHEDNIPNNSLQSCALPTICLGPTGKFQGSYNFLNLISGFVIKRMPFTKLPARQSVIHHITELAATLGFSRLLFTKSK